MKWRMKLPNVIFIELCLFMFEGTERSSSTDMSKNWIKIENQNKFENKVKKCEFEKVLLKFNLVPFHKFFDFKKIYCQISSALKGQLEKVQNAWCEYTIMHFTWEYLRTITLLHKSNQPGTSSIFGKSLHHNLKG